MKDEDILDLELDSDDDSIYDKPIFIHPDNPTSYDPTYSGDEGLSSGENGIIQESSGTSGTSGYSGDRGQFRLSIVK